MIKIITVMFLLSALPVYAQMNVEFTPTAGQWQLTLDVIKTKAQTLLLQNKALVSQREDLQGQIDHLRASINQQQRVNNELRQMIKERNGRTDQQMALEGVVAQVKAKKGEVAIAEGELINSKKKLQDLERKIKLQKLKLSEYQLQQDQREVRSSLSQALLTPEPLTVEATAQLNDVRKQLEEAKAQEALLESQLAAAKNNKVDVAAQSSTIDAENKTLAQRLESLNQQKAQRQKDADTAASSTAIVSERVQQMKKNKIHLESQISLYEAKSDQLKKSLIDSSLPWQAQKKRMIHEMVQLDARNAQLRERITGIREDVNVLQDQITKTERRISANEMRDDNKPKKSN